MTVKILIKRKFKEEAMKDASTMLIKARTNAMGKQGYISSETLKNCDKPNEILVLSMWQTKADWDAYQDDPARKALEKEFEGFFESPTEYSSFKLGLS